MTQQPEPVTTHRSTVPAALAQLVMRCLEKKPADRWQSAEEMLAQLEAMATPTTGLTPTTAPRERTYATKMLGPAGIGVAALLLAGVGTMVGEYESDIWVMDVEW